MNATAMSNARSPAPCATRKWSVRKVRGTHPERALETFVERQAKLCAGETIVAATSGGPDSGALAALLAHAASRAGASLLLAHVNHALRPSAWQDEAVVLALGAALRLRVVAVSLEPGPPSEARLRDERYAALAKVACDNGASRIFTAHHARDQTETVLLALFRGTGPDGLCGIPFERELSGGTRVVRPLLGVEPEELAAYLAAHHLPLALDPTNVEGAFRRNAVRAALAGLRPVFPRLDAAVARCATILAEERTNAGRAELRLRLRDELAAALGDTRDVGFERLDAAASAIERGAAGRHFLRRGVEVVVE